jgi:hypothetical protein
MTQATTGYEGPIRARVRKGSRSGFVILKNGFCGLRLIIEGDTIQVRAPGIHRRLARVLGIEFSLAAREVTMDLARIGWLGTLLLRRDWVVLSRTGRVGVDEVAIRPRDGDLARLGAALTDAGVRATRRPPDRARTGEAIYFAAFGMFLSALGLYFHWLGVLIAVIPSLAFAALLLATDHVKPHQDE